MNRKYIMVALLSVTSLGVMPNVQAESEAGGQSSVAIADKRSSETLDPQPDSPDHVSKHLAAILKSAATTLPALTRPAVTTLQGDEWDGSVETARKHLAKHKMLVLATRPIASSGAQEMAGNNRVLAVAVWNVKEASKEYEKFLFSAEKVRTWEARLASEELRNASSFSDDYKLLAEQRDQAVAHSRRAFELWAAAESCVRAVAEDLDTRQPKGQGL